MKPPEPEFTGDGRLHFYLFRFLIPLLAPMTSLSSLLLPSQGRGGEGSARSGLGLWENGTVE